MATVAKLIGRALDGAADEQALAKVKHDVAELARAFPLYASRLARR